MKQGGARAYPRYKLFLPLELQSIETISDNMTYPPLRFKTVTRNISLGGVLIELGKDMNGLKNDWKPEWFKKDSSGFISWVYPLCLMACTQKQRLFVLWIRMKTATH